MAKNWNHKIGAAATVVVALNLVAAAAAGGAIYLVKRELAAINRTDQMIVDGEVGARNLNRLQTLLQETSADRRRLNDYLVAADSLPQLINQLEATATAAGVNLAFTDVATIEKPLTVKLGFNLEGAFVDVFQFLGLLENLPAKVRLNQAEISSVPGVLHWQGKLTIEAFGPPAQK